MKLTGILIAATLIASLSAGCRVTPTTSGTPADLHDAVMRGATQKAEALLAGGVDANAVNDQGESPLYWASSLGHTDIVKLLLDHGADVDGTTPDNATPLHEAARNRQGPVVEILIAAGADVNARTDASMTGTWTPLGLAEREGHTEVARILKQHGATR